MERSEAHALAPSSPSAPAVERPRWYDSVRRLRASRTAARFGFESVLIILSVLVGLALNDWRERRAERGRAAAAVANFRRELGENLADLARRQPKHAAFARRLREDAEQNRPGETAFSSFRRLMPPGGLDNAPMRDAAWETALSTGALRLIDYERAALLSETYLVQRTISGTVQRLSDRFMMPENFDPALRPPHAADAQHAVRRAERTGVVPRRHIPEDAARARRGRTVASPPEHDRRGRR